MKRVSAEQVKAIVDRDEGTRVINVLPEEHFRKKHIPGSISVPLEEDSFLQRVEHLVEDKESGIVVYCADAECNASPKAAEALEDAGFRNVVDFPGGLLAWQQAGYPMEGQAVGS